MTDRTLREKIETLRINDIVDKDDLVYNLAIGDALRILDAHPAAQPAPSAASTDNTALVEALGTLLVQANGVEPRDDALRHSVRRICSAALTGREAKPAPDAAADARIADDDSLASRISELGWQIHNLGCEYQNDEKLLDRLQDLRGMAWEIADIAREARQ